MYCKLALPTDMRTQLVFKDGPSLCVNTNLSRLAIGELMASYNRCLTYPTTLLYTAKQDYIRRYYLATDYARILKAS
jgi:hypothetical protein